MDAPPLLARSDVDVPSAFITEMDEVLTACSILDPDSLLPIQRDPPPGANDITATCRDGMTAEMWRTHGWIMLVLRTPDRKAGCEIQIPHPLEPLRPEDLARAMRHATDVARSVISSLRAPAAERAELSARVDALTLGIGRRVVDAQGSSDLTAVAVRFPSPCDAPGAQFWNGEGWFETLGPEHAVWRTIDLISVAFRRRTDGSLLMHMSGAPTEQPDEEATPMETLRALAALPHAPDPRRVTG
jgi:hypothetical protein